MCHPEKQTGQALPHHLTTMLRLMTTEACAPGGNNNETDATLCVADNDLSFEEFLTSAI